MPRESATVNYVAHCGECKTASTGRGLPNYPYCSSECRHAAEVRAALGKRRCEACYAVVPLRGGFASGPDDDPQLPGVCCSPDCYSLIELREQIAPSSEP